jgi:LmbE family N-acetylglucosaminyl deacetylase
LTKNHDKVAMVVTAHPDDAEWGCSGSVAKWTRLGWDVVYVLCTDGSKGTEDREISSEKLSKIREEEQRNAGKILGLKAIEFLGYPDGYLEPSLDVRRDISREIRKYKPSVLITTNPKRDLLSGNYLGHPDHFAAGEAALSAVFPSARDHLTFPELLEEGLEPHKVKQVWINMFNMGNLNNNLFFNPLEKKDVELATSALLAHVSQISDPDRAKEYMSSRRQEVGRICGSDFAEAFAKFELN